MKTIKTLSNLPRRCFIALAVAALLLALPAVTQAQFNYTTNNGAITITGYTGSDSDVIIPATINGLPVTSIGDGAFYDFYGLTSVTIPNSVTSIGVWAFAYCHYLTSVTIGNSVTSIGDWAFSDCYNLTSVTIGNSVTSIGDWAFAHCGSLTSITIPNSVTSIGDYAFSDCPNLTSITIGNTVTSIGDWAFAACSLTNVMIPNSVTSIGDSAFADCSSLTSVTIGNSVTSIGSGAFANCSGLTNIAVDVANPSYASAGGVLFDKNKTTLIRYPIGNAASSYAIPGSVTSINGDAFAGCSLTNVMIPNSVTSIGDGAFADCSGLKSVTIGNSVTSIGNYAFAYCPGLTNIAVDVANPSYASAGGVLFNKSLTLLIQYPGGLAGSYAVPNSVTSLGEGAFYGGNNLISVFFMGNAPVAGSSVFSGNYVKVYYLPNTTGWSTTLAGVPTALMDQQTQFGYTIANNRVTIAGYVGADVTVNMPDTINGLPVIGIAAGAFYNNENIAGVNIPNSITSIGESAFEYCYNLTNVMIGNGVTSIREYAFHDCSSLTSVAIPNSVTSIGNEVFYDCESLTNVTIGSGVTNIGDYAFYNCSSLTSVTIPNSVTNIGFKAFAECLNLTGVFFSGNAPTADPSAFSDDFATVCYLPNTTGWSSTFAGLSTVMVAGPPQFGTTGDGWNYASDGVNITITRYAGSDSAVNIPATINGLPVTSIGDGVFANHYDLTSVTIPDSVTSIGAYAFEDCYEITDIAFMGDAPAADLSVFDGDNRATVYYLSGTAGWSATYDGLPAVMLNVNGPPQFGTTTNGLNYAGDGVNLIIAKYTGSGGDVTIPATINGLPVTSIGDNAFAGMYVTAVTIPDSVTSIGANAFAHCGSLTNIVIGNNVATIGNDAFLNCAFNSITIPGSVTNLGYALDNCFNLTTINVDAANLFYSSVDGVLFDKNQTTLILYPISKAGGNYAIPNGVTRIGNGAFYVCFSLTNVTMPGSVTNIGFPWFDDCQHLAAINVDAANLFYSSVDGVLFNKNQTTLILYPISKPGSNYAIPNSVTRIETGAFYQTAVTNVTIPDSVTDLGNGAFNNCVSLAQATIGNGVSRIGSYTFFNCYNLTSVTIGSGVTSIGDNAFAYTALLDLTIPDGVTNIGDNAFFNCISLGVVTIGSGVTHIGAYAFAADNGNYYYGPSTTSLADVLFKGNAPISVGVNAFSYYLYSDGWFWNVGYVSDHATAYFLPTSTGWSNTFAGLPTALWDQQSQFGYTITNGAITIVGYFGSDGAVNIPATINGYPVTGIGADAFSPYYYYVYYHGYPYYPYWQYSSSSITSVTIPNSVTSIGDYAFDGCNNLIYVLFMGNAPAAGSSIFPGNYVKVYYLPNTTGWSNTLAGMPTAVLGQQIQFGYTIANNLVTIVGYVGSDVKVNIPDTINGLPVIGIAAGAFYNNENMAGVNIPNSITSIGESAFEYCYNLTNVVLGTGVTNIGEYAFAYTALLNLAIPDSVVNVGNYAFQYCYGLTNVTMGNGVTSIGNGAFEECTNLTSVTIGSGVIHIGDGAFADCGLTNVMIPNSVTSIGDGAFDSCINLTSVIIGNNVTNIGIEAFEECTNLTSVTIGNNVTSIGDSAFAGCSDLTSVTIPNSVTSIGAWAFGDCYSLTAFNVNFSNVFYSSKDGVLFDKSRTLLVQFPQGIGGTYIIPDSVTSIGQYAFYGCSLTNVIIGNGVTSIGDGAFFDCNNLTSVKMGNSVAYIGSAAFAATAFTSITIPNSVTNIGGDAFSGAALTSVAIPNSVMSIGDSAFWYCGNLTNVTIGSGVANIGYQAFNGCFNLTAINVDAANVFFSSVEGVLFNKGQTTLIQCPGGLSGSYTIPASVTNIENVAFYNCQNLSSVTIDSGLTSIGDSAFAYCYKLTSVYFKGNAPSADYYTFNDTIVTVYYLPNTTGWGNTFAGLPTALWLPQVQTGDGSFGVRTNQFGFNIAWASGQTVVVEAATNLSNPVWLPLATNTLTSDSSYFSDPQPANLPARFYRLKQQQ